MIIRGFDGGWPELNNGYTYKNSVSKPSCIGLSLIDYLHREWPSSGSIEEWDHRIRAAQVTLNGAATSPSSILRGNDVVVYMRPPYSEPDCPDYLQILYQDIDMIAINKPSGIQVLPRGPFLQRTALEILKRYGEMAGLVSAPAPVHRIGRGTSGILICAVSPKAKRMLAEAMIRSTVESSHSKDVTGTEGTRSLRKIYRCRVVGLIQEDQGTIDAAIGPIEHKGVVDGLHAALALEQGGKASLSKFKVLYRDTVDNTSLVEVEIFTGRPHQIRIHMSFIGHPLLGDPLYGPGGVPIVDHSRRAEGGEGGRGGGGVDGTALQAMPGDTGYLLHSHILELPLPSERDLSELDSQWARKIDGKAGYIRLEAPLPRELMTPQEMQLG